MQPRTIPNTAPAARMTPLRALVLAAALAPHAAADLPAHTLNVDDTVYLRFHGRGDVLKTKDWGSAPAFTGSGIGDDMGDALHVRMRVRLAPESEYEILDDSNSGAHATGRTLWNQGTVDYQDHAGFSVDYRHDTDHLYFTVGDAYDDAGTTEQRTRMWRTEIVLDDGVFRTIDWGYDQSTGQAACWIDGLPVTVTAVLPAAGALQPAPQLTGAWENTGTIMGGRHHSIPYVLSGAGRAWYGVIGARVVDWPAANVGGSDAYAMDQNTSTMGDVAYAAFRWADATVDINSDGWDVELTIDDPTDGLYPDDAASGLNAQELVHAEHDDILPAWIDESAPQPVTSWVIGDLTDSGAGIPQTRQLLYYHHGLGDETITVTEDNGSGAPLTKSIVCCLDPTGDVAYWAIKTASTSQHTIVGVAPSAGVHSFDLPAGEPGIYRIIVKSLENEGYHFETNQEPLHWGAYAPFAALTGVDTLPATDAWAYVPADSTQYDLRLTSVTGASQHQSDGTYLTTLDDNWNAPDFDPPEPFHASAALISFDLGSGWQISARRFPLVLCPSRMAAADYIRAGVIEENGHTLWSPDDKRLRDRIVTINPSTCAADDFNAEESHIVSHPRRYQSLAGGGSDSLPLLHTALAYQVTSSSSQMIGSIDENPADGITTIPYGEPTSGDATHDAFAPALLFFAGWDDTSANPYYNQSDLKKRARAGALAFARHVQGTRLRRTDADNSTWTGYNGLSGSDVFGLALHFGRVYSILDTSDKTALLPSVVSQLCHILNSNPTSTRNQDCHVLPFLYESAKLWSDLGLPNATTLMDVNEDYAESIVARTGWQHTDDALMEAHGFDGSYTGIQNHMIALGWIVSGPEFNPDDTDPDYSRDWTFLRDALDRQYKFWAHYLAPPVDGISDPQAAFAHDSDSRTTRGVLFEQYEGAKAIASMAAPMIARLTLEDGSPLAARLLDPTSTGAPALNTLLPLSTGSHAAWTGTREPWSFDLVPLYTGGFEHLFNGFGVPNPTGAEYACETDVTEGIVIEQQGESFIAVHTPCYYAIVATHVPSSDFYYQDALGRYGPWRAIEDPANTTGGGSQESEAYPDGQAATVGEEIGGAGLSMFYDKTDAGLVIAGRNWSPLTTHQLIGFTDGTPEERRWADPDTLNHTLGSYVYDTGGSPLLSFKLTITYSLNKASGDPYEVTRVLHFKEDRIDVTVAVAYPSSGTPEPLDRIVENIPFELGERVIGTSLSAARLADLQSHDMPWPGGSTWTDWCSDGWTSSTNEGLTGRGQLIGWLQKDMGLPTQGGAQSFLAYTIAPLNACSGGMMSTAPGGTDKIARVLRAIRDGDLAGDANGDGRVDHADLRAVIDEAR